MKMPTIYKIIVGVLLCCIFKVSLAEPSVTDKLQSLKQQFSEKAPQQKVDDYEAGINQVKNSGVLKTAKNVGDTAPDFTLENAYGKSISLYTQLEKGPVVLVWYRGEWCPYCNIYLNDVHQHIDKFKEMNATVIAISPAKPDSSWTAKEKEGLQIEVLSDIASKVAKQYGIAYKLPDKIADYYQKGFDLHSVNQDDSNILPLSASYVIDKNAKITYAFLDADYKKRAETEVLLQEVKKLQNNQ